MVVMKHRNPHLSCEIFLDNCLLLYEFEAYLKVVLLTLAGPVWHCPDMVAVMSVYNAIMTCAGSRMTSFCTVCVHCMRTR